jgi:hypothetical protein
MILVIFFEFSQTVPTLKTSFLAALNSVVARSLKYYKKGKKCYSKIVSVLEVMLMNYQGEIEQDILEKVLGMLLKFQLNGNINQDKDLMTRIEVVSLVKLIFEFKATGRLYNLSEAIFGNFTIVQPLTLLADRTAEENSHR